MKTYLSYSFILAAAACGLATGQTAYTNPVGYTTQSLAANSFNLVGLNVVSPTLTAGVLTSAAGTTVGDSTQNFTTLIPAGKMAILEITSGAAAGLVQEFTSWSAGVITLPVSASAAVGDSYKVRLAQTVQQLFDATNLTTAGINPTNADKVWVPTGIGGAYTKYWLKTGVNAGWHTTVNGTTDTGLVTGDIPVIYIDGLLVEKKGTATDLVMSGEVKTKNSNSLVVNGFNLLSIPSPVGSTLFTAGLTATDLTPAGINPTNADKLWVPGPGGSYTKYWLKTGVSAGWHTTVTGTTDTGLVTTDVTLPAAVFIERKATGSGVVSLEVPTGYSSL
jgi:hypothetical protein